MGKLPALLKAWVGLADPVITFPSFISQVYLVIVVSPAMDLSVKDTASPWQMVLGLPEKSAEGDLKATTNCVLVAEYLFPDASVTVSLMVYFPGLV